ncbi:glycoside hydrolase family 65 protein [Planococcus donghaensis]|uniref:Family 65 glycosyl hydrolase n=1 Tax=Planococcus donghaensis TaxID=414778 RepID=A0A1C7EDD0_9BACL|nr:glycosyl hydrolase family 65 protein [Planococcus donghaensis]ANU22033.1 family 65 glycosyl hydrolase [Planococcus donghaensis]
MINYSVGTGDLKNWIVAETDFSADVLGKSEAIMMLGNGYMGLRSATEEPYIQEKRNLFINGTFNKSQENEVTELPNAADFTQLDIRVDGERFSLEFGETNEYIKQLNLKTAELTRSFVWESPKKKKLQFKFSRFVSLNNMHLIAMKVEVESLSHSVAISFDSGINGQMTNSGAQHFLEGERRILDERFIQLSQKTSESDVEMVFNTVHHFRFNGEPTLPVADKDMQRRKVWMAYEFYLEPNDKLEMEKLSTVHTSRDQVVEQNSMDFEQLRQLSIEELKQYEEKGYDVLFKEHVKAWHDQVWKNYNFKVESDHAFDQLALRFSLYHLTAMQPPSGYEHLGVGAKAMSGEGYKGHTFWDLEIFILPFFIYSNPTAAKSLLTYRYHGLAGARKKAEENGYAGAMYPWEMAWPEDGETTPIWGDIDIVTGAQSKIWSGFIEQHISADIAFAVYQYEQVTGDKEFMERCGYEMIFETAKFWSSRLEWNEERERYEIHNVIGPDEYKEHVSNNAFTNYMAYFNLKLAERYAEQLSAQNPQFLETFDLGDANLDWKTKAEKLYLPEPRTTDLIIPQDDTYLQLPEIDLAKYKNQSKVRMIYRDYNSEQINGIQVTKQADTLLLFYLLEQTFLQQDSRLSSAVKQENYQFYEPRTLHDSSLSLAVHAVIANDLGESDTAYSLFRKACEIDLGEQMNTSDDGIHAAAIGGIWTSAVFGFGGVRFSESTLQINPRLPKQWRRMQFAICWQGTALTLEITHQSLKVTAYDGAVTFETDGKTYHIQNGEIEIQIGREIEINSH